MSVFQSGNMMGGVNKIPIVEATATVYSGSKSLTISYDASGNDRLLVVYSSSRTSGLQTVSSITFNGIAGTVISQLSIDGGSANNTIMAYWKEADLPSITASYTLDIQYTGFNDQIAHTISLSDVDQVTPIGTHITKTAIDQIDGATFTFPALSNESGEFLVAGLGISDTGSFSGVGSFSSPVGLWLEHSDTYAGTTVAGMISTLDAVADNSETYSWDVTTGRTNDSLTGIIAVINGA